MVIERSDKKKNTDKVVASLLKNPLQSQREVEKDTGISRTTVGKVKANLDKTGQKDSRIVNLTDKDFNCIKLGVEEIERRLSDKTELDKMRSGEISQVIKENTARYTLFKGDVTDKSGGLKDMSKLSDDELNNIINDK